MTFLQPILLAALPLMALPILIHLINRQRHRTISWGAMMFLLDAKRRTRGIAQLRYWLIMAMRMLAIAALILAVARPLASGRMGLALGGAPDTSIIILDRSASMQLQDLETGESKQTAALRKLSELLQTVGPSARAVLIHNGDDRVLPIDSADALLELTATAPTDSASDVPAMLQTALDYVVANKTGRTDIWICSDLRIGDWLVQDGRWAGLRDGFRRLEGVRFYILSYPGLASRNLSVWVERCRVVRRDQSAQLVLDVLVRRPAGGPPNGYVPVEFVINGARSVVNIQMTDVVYRLQGHTLALDERTHKGWGYVELPADANLHDNRYYFVFGDPPPRHAVIVSDDVRSSRPMQIATVSPVDPALSYTAAVLPPNRLDTLDWNQPSLLLWQVPLPDGELARHLESFVRSGRPILFFPPDQPDTTAWNGFRWGAWETAESDEPLQVLSWHGDSDLLQHSLSGVPLPVGKLRVYRYCAIEGDGQPLSTLTNGAVLLTRSALGQGLFYFLATLPRPGDSSLLQDGVVFYVMLHRALAAGTATGSELRQLSAGTSAAREVAAWRPLSTLPMHAISTEQCLHAGTFQHEEQLAAVNRPASEDHVDTVDDEQLAQLLQGLSYRHVEEEIGSASTLASEIWRVFVLLTAVALITEALLCLPEKKPAGGVTVGPLES